MKILFFFLLLTAPLSLIARIGETTEEIRKRYGYGKEIGSQLLLTADGFDVTITFQNNHSVMEIYCPRSVAADEKPLTLSLEDSKKLLELHGEGKSWQKISLAEDPSKATWRRADGKVFARFSEKSSTLTFLPSLPTEIK